MALLNARHALRLVAVIEQTEGQAKGGSRLAWFLASILLGPIATFLIVVTDNPPPKAPK